MLNELKLIVIHKKKVKFKIFLIKYLMNLWQNYKNLCKCYYVKELLIEVMC